MKSNYSKDKKSKTIANFSDFMRNASAEEKNRVFTEIAMKANADQRETYRKAMEKLEQTIKK